MAKTVKKNAVIGSLDDVNTVMQEMSQLWAERMSISSQYEPELRRMQAELNAKLAPIDERYADLEARVQEYAIDHTDVFKGKKSLDLPYGTIAMRSTENIDVPDPAFTAEKLISIGQADCVKTSSTPIKASLKRLGDELLALVGAVRNRCVSITVRPLGKD